MGVRRTDPVEDRRRALMRQADGKVSTKFSLGGHEKQGAHAPRKPSLPKMPWDDKPEDKSDGG